MKLTDKKTSLRGLRTFCIAARHLSFKLAAEELFVSASAVSRQVKSLETELGIKLFERGTRELDLTDAGRMLFEELDPLIREVDRVAARFRQKHQRQTLRISVQPFFASELFVPRLSEFTARHPQIDMTIDTADERSETHPSSVDVSIRLFRSAPLDLEAEALFPMRLLPACAPSLYEKIVNAKTGKPGSFTRLVHARRRGQWKLWSESSGIDLPESASTIELNSTVAVMRAAEQGLGVAIVPMPLSQEFLSSGRLRALYEHEVPTPDRYYFVTSPTAAAKPAVRLLRNWAFETFTVYT